MIFILMDNFFPKRNISKEKKLENREYRIWAKKCFLFETIVCYILHEK